MKKLWFSLVILLVSTQLFSQVKLNLTFQAETMTYTVSMVSDATYTEPKNMVGAVQIVLRSKFNVNFTPIITSRIEGVIWADNAYVDYPAATPEYTYACIALANGPTKKIQFTAGQELPLFSFKNAGGECPGLIELVANEDPQVQLVKASGYNVTQSLSVLGARGNAYAGILNGSIECLVSNTKTIQEKVIEELQIAPVPADRLVTISWENLNEIHKRVELVIMDNKGREVYREKVSGVKGKNVLEIDVSNWFSGVYTMRFQFENAGQTRGWHFMVIR